MNTSFERGKNRTDEWCTPKWIVDALGKFDLDPCAPIQPFQHLADKEYNREQDGLQQEWKGRVWCNPPYDRKLCYEFTKRMADHGNGIALTFDRCDNAMWHDVIFPTADALLFMRGRVKFYRPDGSQADSAGCGSVLIAWGSDNAEALRKARINGKYIALK